MSIRIDYLPNHKDIKVYQDDEMFCINTDTMVLGEFLEVYKQDVVLDIGTNTGALMLYANLFNPRRLVGIDINDKHIEVIVKQMMRKIRENPRHLKASIRPVCVPKSK